MSAPAAPIAATCPLPTVPVDADKVGFGHLVASDDLIVKVTRTYSPGPGELLFFGSTVCRTPSAPSVGTVRARVGETVQCVRVADWLATLAGEAVAS
ncbi:hypothetical protein [Nonomuraea sp. NPDC023979]|uniref:hypothetical protein n=1 Tax=Nonomuraea sp. NPDC023979 TaxID=3154796 RepID=UPI0033CEC1A5